MFIQYIVECTLYQAQGPTGEQNLDGEVTVQAGHRDAKVCGNTEKGPFHWMGWWGAQVQGTGGPQYSSKSRMRLDMRMGQARTLEGLMGEVRGP